MMSSRIILMVLLLYILLLTCNHVRCKNLTINQDMQLKRNFGLHKKPIVKTIHTIFGDTYNCVDFYKQPAFDHPLLKNHSFDYQMKLNYYLKGVRDENPDENREINKIWRNGKGCPIGTVPINAKSNPSISNYKNYKEEPGLHFAGLQTRTKSDQTYKGAGMFASLHTPKVAALQYSGGLVHVQGGSDYIQAGWMVNPNLNPDSRTRMFIFTHTNGVHCFNLLCSGFVVVKRNIAIDRILQPVSVVGGPIYGYQFLIIRDWKAENWWLVMGRNKTKTKVGYWPHHIFSGLQGSANYIRWGGVAYSPTGIYSPPMGTGTITSPGRDHVAFFENVVTVDDNYETVNAENLLEYGEGFYYDVRDAGFSGKSNHLFWYGGPGGYIAT